MLLVLAVALQGYIVQAHFHDLPSGGASPAIVLSLDDGASQHARAVDLPANLPDGHNDQCDLCNLIALGTFSVLPSILPLAVPTFAPLAFADLRDVSVIAARPVPAAARGPPSPFASARA
ncbi:MAG TPA: hypothetical protein VGO34_02095 [Alphaproteobacteria bacterium]